MGALDGVKVIDLTTMVSGPVAATILADQGAEVIKIEPLHGEQMRHLRAARNSVNPMFFSCNRGKKSLPLDLKSDKGKEILWKLVEQADVFIQNFRPGAIERMGFGEDALRKRNPGLINVSISGFGEKGPYAQKRVYDPVIQALSGAADIQANRQTGTPQMFRLIVADKITSITAAQAISAALYARNTQGMGQHIKLSMLDCMLSFMWPEGMTGITFAEQEVDVTKNQSATDLVFPTQDGHITAGAVSDSEWQGMCRAFGREELITDERFKTSLDRFKNAELRRTIMAEEIAKWSSEDILKRLDKEDVPCAPILLRMELMDHEQIKTNNSIVRQEFEDFGEVRQARPPAEFAQTPSNIADPAPKLGEHTIAILQELGFSEEEQRDFIKEGITRDLAS
ncbi:MAG: CoA transferase [Sneathiellales bacterium]|nr:CoA transferase [Sneathiellales bacterium]